VSRPVHHRPCEGGSFPVGTSRSTPAESHHRPDHLASHRSVAVPPTCRDEASSAEAEVPRNAGVYAASPCASPQAPTLRLTPPHPRHAFLGVRLSPAAACPIFQGILPNLHHSTPHHAAGRAATPLAAALHETLLTRSLIPRVPLSLTPPFMGVVLARNLRPQPVHRFRVSPSRKGHGPPFLRNQPRTAPRIPMNARPREARHSDDPIGVGENSPG
jgi:hypothetical protein